MTGREERLAVGLQPEGVRREVEEGLDMGVKTGEGPVTFDVQAVVGGGQDQTHIYTQACADCSLYMDPTTLLLPRVRDSDESMTGTPLEVQQVTKALALRRSLFGVEDDRFGRYCAGLIRDVVSRKEEVHVLEAIYEQLEDLPLSLLSQPRSQLCTALSQAYRLRNQPSQARKYASKAIALTEHTSEGEHPAAYLQYSGLLRSVGRHKEAVEQAKRAVEQVQEELVTSKLKRQGEKAAELMKLLISGYRSLGAALESVQGYREAASWYHRAAKFASESGDIELELQVSALQSAFNSATRKAEGLKASDPPSSTSKYRRKAVHSSDMDWNMTPESSDPSSFLISGRVKAEESSIPSGIDQDSSASSQVSLNEEDKLMFLWRNDWNETEKQHRSTQKVAGPKDPHPPMSRNLSFQTSFASSSLQSRPKTPLKIRDLHSKSMKSQESSQKMEENTGNLSDLMEDLREREGIEGIIYAIKVKIARKSMKKREIASEKPNLMLKDEKIDAISQEFATFAAASNSKPPSFSRYATTIQSAYRALRAKNYLKLLKKYQRRTKNQKLVHRRVKMTSSGLVVVSVYEMEGGKVVVRGEWEGKDRRVCVNAEGKVEEVVEKVEVVNGELVVLGSEEAPLPPDKPTSHRVPPASPNTELARFLLTHHPHTCDITLIHTGTHLEIQPLPQHKALFFPSKTPLSDLQIRLGDIETEGSLQKLITVHQNTLIFDFQKPVFTSNRCFSKHQNYSIYCFSMQFGLQIRLLSQKEIVIIDVNKEELGKLMEITENKGKNDCFCAISALYMDKNNEIRLFLPSNRDNLQIIKAQALIRRFLARKKADFIRFSNQKRQQNSLISRKLVVLNEKYAQISFIKSQKGLKIVSLIEKKEQEILVKPEIWRKFGKTEIEAVNGILENLELKEGKLAIKNKQTEEKISEKRENFDESREKIDENKVKTIQKWTRGKAARKKVSNLTKSRTLVLCKRLHWGWGALYKQQNLVVIEAFYTQKSLQRKSKSTVFTLKMENITDLYGFFPGFDRILLDFDVSAGILRVSGAESVVPPTFLLTTLKPFNSDKIPIHVFTFATVTDEIMQFRCENDQFAPTEASLPLLSQYSHIPIDEIDILALVSVHFLLEIERNSLKIVSQPVIFDLVSSIIRIQAYIRGFLMRTRRSFSLSYSTSQLVACGHRVLSGQKYALYAYFQDNSYKLEAICKSNREKLKLFLDESVFFRFGPKINRKKVFRELVFPRVEVQSAEKCRRLCVNPVFPVGLEVKDYVRTGVTEKQPALAIFREKRKRSGRKKTTNTVTFSLNPPSSDSSPTTKTVIHTETTRFTLHIAIKTPPELDFIPILSPKSVQIEANFDDFEVEKKMEPVMERIPGLEISPIPIKPNLSFENPVLPIKIDEKPLFSPINLTKSRFSSLIIPSESIDELKKQLILRMGLDFTAGFCTISIYSFEKGLELEAISVNTQETALGRLEVDVNSVEIGRVCDELVEVVDVIRTDAGKIVVFVPGNSPFGSVLYYARQVIGGNGYKVTISMENQCLIVRASEENSRKTLEMSLGRRNRREEEISAAELQAVAGRLQVQRLFGQDTLLLDAV